MLLNNQWITGEIKKEIKKYLETNEDERTTIQNPMGHDKGSSKREVHSNKIIPQQTTKITNKQPNLPPKELENEKSKTQSSRINHKDQTRN